MCGILGLLMPAGERAAAHRSAFDRALGRLEHRGPDGRGVEVRGNVALGHTRLAVRDPLAKEAAQPLTTPCGRYSLVYNGELYDDAAWRAELSDEVYRRTDGVGFRTRCDAETLLWILIVEGTRALDRLRGMYALAFVDWHEGSLLLARDPLGIKPLVHARTAAGGWAFASEPGALLALPDMVCEPDAEMIATYLATSRRSAFGRTLFEGVRAVEPGDVLRFDLTSPDPAPVLIASGARFSRPSRPDPFDAAACATVVEESVQSHLVSDVPLCSLLSGGLDSAIITSIAARGRAGHGDPLTTWCATGVEAGAELGPDPEAARVMAAELGTVHSTVAIEREAFLSGWRAHVEHLGQPLSTPNEVAIAEISRALRAGGSIVALSGEGADELFGGYDQILAAFAAHAAMESPPIDAGRFHLEATAWISPAAQDALLVPGLAGSSAFVIEAMRARHSAAAEAAGPGAHPVEAHLRMQRAVNLTSLLERLDAATMRFGVEGRTPFADLKVLQYAEELAFRHKFEARADGDHRSKIALREAFGAHLPPSIVARPKASFPMPFERWAAPLGSVAAASEFVAEFVRVDVLRRLAESPAAEWRLGWLLGNLALFGEAAFGAHPAAADELRTA